MRCFKIFIMMIMFSMTIFLFNNIVKADYQATVVITDGSTCELSSKATGKCIYQNANLNTTLPKVVWLDTGDQVTVVTSKPSLNGNRYCSGRYVNVNYSFPSKPNVVYNGYFCDANLSNGNVNDNYKNEFRSAGFPESYWSKLSILKTAHPNWTFKAINTNLDFNTAVSNETSLGRSLIQVTSSTNNEGYLSTDSGAYNYYNDTYTVYDGSNWYNANKETIAYYMDPRNSLIDMYVFQYEALAYEKNLQTLAVVQQLLKGDYLNNFASSFISAASDSNVSPVYLASLSKQEVGGRSTASTAISGGSFTYAGKTYSNIYNPYNIGATSGADNVYKGLYWAAGSGLGYNTYDRPWNSMDKAIRGGAKWIGANYINLGQNTSYFKKWNVVYNYNTSIKDRYSNYTHQYMTNIQAPTSEANSTYKSYYNSKVLDSSFVFYIPVYLNMPNITSLPNTGNQNNYLSSLSINGTKISAFDGATTTYNYYVDGNVTSVSISANPVKYTSSVSGTGNISLTSPKTTRTISVKAENGQVRNYTINIIKNDNTTTPAPSNNNTTQQNNTPSIVSILNRAGIKNGSNYITGLGLNVSSNAIANKIKGAYASSSVTIKNSNGSNNSGSLKTGDIINIKVGNESKNYTAVIYGDVSGDGKINAVDYVKIKNFIMGRVSINNSYREAADANKDGKVNAVDYVKIKNYIMGRTTINQ